MQVSSSIGEEEKRKPREIGLDVVYEANAEISRGREVGVCR
jgi:hypothetical protein